MKKLLFLFAIVCSFSASATNHYFATAGSNANNGLAAATAKQTIAQLNIDFPFYAAGDTIFFNRGDVFTGGIIAGKSGTITNPIVITAYGTGAAPLISGFVQLTNWINDGGGVYHCNTPAADTGLRVVTVNNNLQFIGRYPNVTATNKGYLNITASSGNTITTSEQSTGTNWTGADVVIRRRHWKLNVDRITSHSGGILTFDYPYDNSDADANNVVGLGAFFQNDIRTLDQFGEWFLNKSTKDFSMFFGAAAPASYTIKVSTTDTLLNFGGNNGRQPYSYITIKNIAFEGANKVAIYSKFCGYITTTNCKINNCLNGIYHYGICGQIAMYDTVTNCLSNGINCNALLPRFPNGFTYPYYNLIQYDSVKNCGIFEGMGGSGDGSYQGITQAGSNSNVLDNRIDSIGYIPLVFTDDTVKIQRNYITNFCYVKDDGSGIYTGNNFSNGVNVNREVSNNTISGGIGAIYGTPNFSSPHNADDCNGIYIDAHSFDVNVHDNNVSNLPYGAAVFLHVATNVRVRNNIFSGVRIGLTLAKLSTTQFNSGIVFANNTVNATTNNFNYFDQYQNNPTTQTMTADVAGMFTTLDSNKYNAAATFYYYSSQTAAVNNTLAQFKSLINVEANGANLSSGSNTFYSNPTSAPTVINYNTFSKIVNGITYDNSYTLPAFTGAILFDNGNALGIAIRHYFLKRKHK